MGIMALLVSGAVAAINAIAGGQTMGQTGATIGSVLDRARTVAMAHNTYVWVGFLTVNDSSGNPSGLEITAVESVTGQSSDLSAGSLNPIMVPKFVPNVNLSQSVSISGMDTASSDLSIGGTGVTLGGSFTASVAGTNRTFTQLLQFSPQGETLVKAGTLVPWVNVGLAPIHGKAANVAAVQVSGTTGDVRVFQP
jgi:hypothetical protein